MKKLIATLFLATLGFGFVAMAASKPTYTLTNGYEGNVPILEAVLPIQYGSDYIVYQPSTDLTMTYTVQNSINRILQNKDGSRYDGLDTNKDDPDYTPSGRTKFDLAQVSFHTNQNTYLTLWTDIDSAATDERRIDLSLKITNYGIYYLDDPSNYISMMNKAVEVEANREFGVYYTAETTYKNSNYQYNMTDPEIRGTTVETTVTTTNNGDVLANVGWVASYDGVKDNNHSLDAVWYSDTKIITREAFFCLYQGPFEANKPAYLEWDHFEFGFASGEHASGQPLPGTLTTIVISGLCAAGLRKKSKKH